MAKSARASGIKKNKAALKKRVFLPAETARNDRLSAKLLELAKAPKPARPAKQEMEVDAAEEGEARLQNCIDQQHDTDMQRPPAAKEDTAKEDEPTTEGALLYSLSVPIPHSLMHCDVPQLLTPPTSPASSLNSALLPAHSTSTEQQFFAFLGAATEVLGFNHQGDLALSFSPDIEDQN